MGLELQCEARQRGGLAVFVTIYDNLKSAEIKLKI